MMVKLGLSASWEKNRNDLQYVSRTMDFTQTDDRYVLGSINQETVGMTFRADLNVTPRFSIQYYGSPFVSRGLYSEFKIVTDPTAGELTNRYNLIRNTSVSGGLLYLDENNDGTMDYFVPKPDFSFYQFRSNLVAKWEYRLGSFVYLVWSSERTGYTLSPNSIGDSFKQLRKTAAKNIFMVKLNYWFSL
jgi:hypothetical protein